jgi:hypothetical protein
VNETTTGRGLEYKREVTDVSKYAMHSKIGNFLPDTVLHFSNTAVRTSKRTACKSDCCQTRSVLQVAYHAEFSLKQTRKLQK